MAIVAITVSMSNLNINFDGIFGENPSHYFYEFLLPNNQKDQINSQINKVTETARIISK